MAVPLGGRGCGGQARGGDSGELAKLRVSPAAPAPHPRPPPQLVTQVLCSPVLTHCGAHFWFCIFLCVSTFI